ncbi:MAG: amidase, partial [Rhodoferax sp.]|nr:amidase [Rhodoferax sp.]
SRDVALIPGGSSSGAAVSVATGAAFVGLGSDTAGSIRIPAALNGIVGFKNTARLVPTDGAVPLSTTLDTVCAMTRSVADAIVVHEILAARSVTRSHAPLAGYRLAMVRTLMLDDVDATVAGAYQRTLAQLRAAGAQVTEIDLPELRELAGLMAQGGFSGAESYALHRAALATVADQMDPRVVARVQRGAAMGAADYIDLVHARRDWIARMEQRLQAFDAVVSPTVPLVAPPLASVAPGAQRDEEFFRVNGLLLRNTNVVNMFDGCALSLPCHAGDELPVGLMVWHGALRDDTVLNIGLQIEQMLRAG